MIKKEGQRYQKFSRRAFMVAGVQGAFMLGLGARLYYLSIVKGESYRLKADNNRLAERTIAPVRGEILDRYGRKIATNVQDFRVVLVPENVPDVPGTLEKIHRIVPVSPRNRRRIERTIKRQRQFTPVTIVKNLTWEQFARLNVSMPNLEGVTPMAGVTRNYPFGPLVAHLVGYVSRPDDQDIRRNRVFRSIPGLKVGREGIERRFEDRLRGKPGNRTVEVNAFSREIREVPPRTDADDGETLSLTLDMDLQKIAAESLGQEAAAAVVMKADTGDILALASSPSYDPNDFNLGISQENWNAILSDPRKPLLNKALMGQYPPASTVKMLVAIAALEKGLITEETTVNCDGSHEFGDRIYHCWEDRGHDRVNLFSAIAKSCDVYFYKLAEKLDIDDLAKVCKHYGLGQKFDIGTTGSVSGIVPTKAWKETARGSSWFQGETLNVAIGQGAMTSTPLQLAVMTARLATGKMIEPTLIRQPDSAGRTKSFAPVSTNPVYLDLMRQSMHQVMLPGGTGHDYKNPRDSARICGKTGTAQVRRISLEERQAGIVKNEDRAWKDRDHALFVGYLPYDDPKYIVSILVQHGGGGGAVATPIGKDLLLAAERLDKARQKGNQNG